MKKITRIAALLAAGALLFGAVGCSGGDDDDPPAKTLEGIRITTDNTVKTQYDVNAELDLLTGVKVTAEYSDKSEENVTDRADITATYNDRDEVKPFTTEAKGIFKVTLAAAYEGKEAALKEPITINVGVELASISMEVVGDVKRTYKQGEPIDPTGIKVTAHYDTGSESVLSNSEVEFWATYKDGDEDKSFTTNLEPGDYDNVTLFATYKGKTANLPATTITIEKNDSDTGNTGGEDDDDDDDEEEEIVNSVSYDFADLSAADLAKFGITSMSGGSNVNITETSSATAPHMVLDGKVGIVATDTGKLKVKPKDGEPLAIAFATTGVTGATAVGDSATLVHFITYPVESGKKYKMKITSGGQSNDTTHKFVVTDTKGKVLALGSTTDGVTLSFEATEDVVCLSVQRAGTSGTSYVGKVTLTETSGDIIDDPTIGPDDGDDDGDEEEEEKAPAEEPVPFTGSFVGLNGASFGLPPLTKETDLQGTTELKSADGSISASLQSNGSGNLKITFSDGKSAGIKYNGSSLKNGTDSLQATVDVSTLTRYISVPVKNGETITVSYTANTSGSGSTSAKVVLADKADGSILQTETVDTTTTTGDKNTVNTISTTVSDDIDVLILFSREGAGGGGIIVTGFEIQ